MANEPRIAQLENRTCHIYSVINATRNMTGRLLQLIWVWLSKHICKVDQTCHIIWCLIEKFYPGLGLLPQYLAKEKDCEFVNFQNLNCFSLPLHDSNGRIKHPSLRCVQRGLRIENSPFHSPQFPTFPPKPLAQRTLSGVSAINQDN